MRPTPLLFLMLLPLLMPLRPAVAFQPPQNWFAERGYVQPTGRRIVACHGYGCARRMEIPIDDSLLRQAAAILAAQRSPAAERQGLREVVRRYTAYLAASFGGRPDVPGSPPGMSGLHGQMDCVDQTANTTSLLLMLQDNKLLRHHRVERPQSRGFFLDGRYPHTTAVIVETTAGAQWAVDPWRRAPGQKPEILPLSRWRQDS